jgi:hypothetical protein
VSKVEFVVTSWLRALLAASPVSSVFFSDGGCSGSDAATDRPNRRYVPMHIIHSSVLESVNSVGSSMLGWQRRR